MNWFFYFVFNLLNLYTHYFAIFVLFIGVLYFILFYEKFKLKLKTLILSNLVVLALFSPQFLKIYSGFLSSTKNINWGLKPNEYFISIFNSFLGWDTALTVIVFLLFLFGLFLKHDIKKNLFGLLYVLLPIIIGFFLSFKMAIIPRYFIFILPIYVVFISKGLINIKYKCVQIFLIFGILVISGFKLAEDYSNPNNPQWREGVDYIEKNSQKEDVILLGDFTEQPFEYYYKGNLKKISLLLSTNITKNKIYYDKIKPKLEANRVWFISLDNCRAVREYRYRIEQDFILIASKQFAGGRVFLYEKTYI